MQNINKQNRMIKEQKDGRNVDTDLMPITPKGLKLLVIGLVVMILGYVLMMGGGSDDPNVFNYEMFNFRRLTFAPVMIVAGIVTIGVGIMKNFDSKKDKE